MSQGSAGVGSIGPLAGLLWAREAGVELLQLPVRGGGEAEAAVLGGRRGSFWDTLGAHAGSARGSAVRALMETAGACVPAFPEILSIVDA